MPLFLTHYVKTLRFLSLLASPRRPGHRPPHRGTPSTSQAVRRAPSPPAVGIFWGKVELKCLFRYSYARSECWLLAQWVW
jgi:hypothetical protein